MFWRSMLIVCKKNQRITSLSFRCLITPQGWQSRVTFCAYFTLTKEPNQQKLLFESRLASFSGLNFMPHTGICLVLYTLPAGYQDFQMYHNFAGLKYWKQFKMKFYVNSGAKFVYNWKALSPAHSKAVTSGKSDEQSRGRLTVSVYKLNV